MTYLCDLIIFSSVATNDIIKKGMRKANTFRKVRVYPEGIA